MLSARMFPLRWFILSLIFVFLTYKLINPTPSFALSVSLSSVTPPSWLSSSSCQGYWDSYDWTHQTNSREYPKNNSSICSGKSPTNPGSCNFYSWPQLWADGLSGVPNYGSCVRTWCDSSNVYASETWNQGYTDGTAEKNYKLYVEDTSSHANTTVSGIGGNRSVVLNFGSKSNAGETIFEQVINGWNEWGSPGTGFSLACTQPPITPTTPPPAPTTPPPAPTATPVPTSPTPQPTPTSILTKGNLTLQIQGIGLNDNLNPLHPNRRIVLYFYPPTDTAFQQKPSVFSGTVTYNPTTGNFSNASFPLIGLLAGQYLVLMRSPEGSLVAQIGTGDGTGPITIVSQGGANYLVDTQNSQDQNAATTVPTLSMANIGQSCGSGNCSFNVIDLLDYNAFVDCFGIKSTTWDCLVHGIFPQTSDSITDINDDGTIDGTDFTTMMKNYGHFGIGQNAMNRDGENIGPITPTPLPITPTPIPTATPTPGPLVTPTISPTNALTPTP